MSAPPLFDSAWYEGMRVLAEREWSEAAARAELHGRGGDAVEVVWARIRDADFAGAAVPESRGGAGLPLGPVLEIAAAAGAGLLPPRFAFEALLPSLVLRALPEQGRTAELLDGIAAGEPLPTAVTTAYCAGGRSAEFVHGLGGGGRVMVIDATASWIAVVDGPALRERVALHVLDGRDIGNACALFDSGEVIGRGADASLPAATARWAGALLAAADALGAASTALDRAIAYAGERRQFGSPIGGFQAVKHALVDRFLDLQVGRALLAAASEGEEIDPVSAAMAKAHVNEAAVRSVNTAIQVHGAIGFTDELGLHLYQRRALVDRELFAGTGAALAVVRRALELEHEADSFAETPTAGVHR